jgi:Anti-sigma-K factor rskA
MENINDLIYAYSLGCLDPEEQQKFMEHLESGDEYKIQELGEFQNLASLLPSILTIENPDPQLKDNVAKKLYRLKDEIRAQRQKNKPLPENQETKIEELNSSNTEKPQDEITTGFEDLTLTEQPNIETSDYFDPIQNTQIKNGELNNLNKQHNPEEKFIQDDNKLFNPALTEENDNQDIVGETIDLFHKKKTPPTNPVRKNNNLMLWGIALFLLLLIGMIATYLNITSKTNNLNHEVEKLKNEVGSLNIQLIGSQEIQEILQSPDVMVINLKGTDLSPNSFGKLIIGSDKGTGYIQLSQMPTIPEDKLFQLWVSISGSLISLRTFQGSDTMGFYSFKMLTLPKINDISFRITEEPASGSTTPSNKVYLLGILNP